LTVEEWNGTMQLCPCTVGVREEEQGEEKEGSGGGDDYYDDDDPRGNPSGTIGWLL